MGGHAHVGVNDVLSVLVVAGVTIPVLTALRLRITLRSGGRGARRCSRTRRFGVRLAGEWLVVGVAVLSTMQAVLWGWNVVEEIVLRRRELDDQIMVPGVGNLKRSFWASICYIAHLWTLKSAFLCLYYDLLPTLNGGSRRLLHFTTVVTAVTFLGLVVAQMAWCRPIGRNWSVGSDFCSPLTSTNWITTLSWINICTDLLISFIPLSIISTLHLSPRERYGFLTIHLLGFLSLFTSFVRFLALYTYTTRHPPDFLPTLHRVVLWSTIEVLVGHLCFCIPAFRACLRQKKSAAASVAERNLDSRNTIRTVGLGTGGGGGGGGEWFDSFASNPNSPLSAIGLQEPAFPSLVAAVGGGGDWFDGFASNPNSPLSAIGLQQPAFPSLVAAVGGGGRKSSGSWMLINDGDGGSDASRDSLDSRGRRDSSASTIV